jgi:dolichol-phosphate mannosyltransferase
MREELRFFPALVRWAGFKTTSINIVHGERASGKSGYNFKKLLTLAINTILAFSDKPLRLTVYLGGLISLGAFLFAFFIFIRAVFSNIPVSG